MTLMEPINHAATGGITCLVADLRNAVAAAAQVIERRNTIPVLDCLHIEPCKNALVVSGTNLDAWMTASCEAVCAKGKPFCVPARVMQSLLAGAAPQLTKPRDAAEAFIFHFGFTEGRKQAEAALRALAGEGRE